MEIENNEEEKNQEIPLKLRWEIVHLKRQGLSGTEVGERVSRPACTCNAIYNKWLITGDVINLPQSGRPRKITSKVEKMIIEEVKQNPTSSVEQIFEETNAELSNKTGRRVLKNNKFKYKTSPEKWILTDEQRKAQETWAKEFVKKPLESLETSHFH